MSFVALAANKRGQEVQGGRGARQEYDVSASNRQASPRDTKRQGVSRVAGAVGVFRGALVVVGDDRQVLDVVLDVVILGSLVDSGSSPVR